MFARTTTRQNPFQTAQRDFSDARSRAFTDMLVRVDRTPERMWTIAGVENNFAQCTTGILSAVRKPDAISSSQSKQGHRCWLAFGGADCGNKRAFDIHTWPVHGCVLFSRVRRGSLEAVVEE